MWLCDVCKTMCFNSFLDALEHEKSCTGHTVDAPISRTTEESSKFRVEEQLAASETKIVELQQSLEQTKQSSQSIIDELESSKEHVVAELAMSQAKIVMLEARLASITNEVQSNSNADDNLDRIQEIEGTTDQYKAWRDRMKSCNDSNLCRYNLMHNARFKIGPHVDKTQLQSLIRELNAMSNMYPHRDAHSEEVNTKIYLLVCKIEELAGNESITLRWDPFKDWVIVDRDDHYLPYIRGGNNNGKGGFIDTNIVPELDDISDAHVQHILHVWMPAYCEERGWEFSIGDNVEIVDATTLALKFERLPHINPKCRLLITTEYECIQLCIING